MAKIEHPRVPVDAIVNLVNHQKQCDQDGVMVQVSRQALAEVLIYVKEVRPDNKWADTGDVAKKPNNDGLPEMLEAARTELRKAVAKVASLEAEKSDLVDIIWRQMQQAEAHTFAPAQPMRETIYAAAKEGNLEYWRASARQRSAFDAWVAGGCEGNCPRECDGSIVDYITNAVHAALASQPPAAPVEAVIGNILRAKFGEDWGPEDHPRLSAETGHDEDHTRSNGNAD